jgi:tetratricopeptide (TPR) repeat protein
MIYFVLVSDPRQEPMNTFTPSQQPLYALPIGERYYHLGEYSKGIDHYTLILEREPHNIRAHLMRALCYESFCDEEDMNIDFSVILQLIPQSAEAAFARGLQLRWDYQQAAIEQFSEAIRIDPAFCEAYPFRAWLRKDAGDIQGAIEDYTTCLKLCPPHAIALIHRADAYLKLGDYVRQVKDLETFLEFYPNSIMRERLCRQIASIWFRLAHQATQEKKRKKTLWSPFWRTFDSYSHSKVWREPEDLNS